MRFGLRKYGNTNPEFLMPPFTLLKQFGGVLPSPNGFGLTNEDTVDSKELEKAKRRAKNAPDEDEDESYEDFNETYRESDRYIKRPKNINTEVPPHLAQELVKPAGGILKTESMEYGMEENEFWKWVEQEEAKAKKILEGETDGKSES